MIDKKTEAIKRLKKLDYFDLSIKEFVDNDKVMISEPPFGAHFFTNDTPKLQLQIDEFEKEYNSLVYAVIHSFTNIGELYNLLYVSHYPEEWTMDNADIDMDCAMAYVINVTHPDCSELGTIGIERTVAGGLKRIW